MHLLSDHEICSRYRHKEATIIADENSNTTSGSSRIQLMFDRNFIEDQLCTYIAKTLPWKVIIKEKQHRSIIISPRKPAIIPPKFIHQLFFILRHISNAGSRKAYGQQEAGHAWCRLKLQKVLSVRFWCHSPSLSNLLFLSLPHCLLHLTSQSCFPRREIDLINNQD